MRAIRLAKILCVAAVGFDVALVAFGNLTDYWTNFAFITEVLDMDEVPAASHIHWRALTSPIRTSCQLHLDHRRGNRGRGTLSFRRCFDGSATAGQAAALSNRQNEGGRGADARVLLYEAGFVAVGGEWFGMWQARDLDAVPSAFRVLITMLGVLIFISLKDEDLA